MVDTVPSEIAFVAGRLVELPFGLTRVKTGVYFLIHRGKVVYVGKSETGARRAMSHLGQKRFDRALFLPVTKKERGPLITVCDIELSFIHRLMPPLNKRGKTGPAVSYERIYVDLDAFYGGRREEEVARWEADLERRNRENAEREKIYAPRRQRLLAGKARYAAWLSRIGG